jgi:catechol 2,3-dioxygenase-like lactoylglutathione lyase family enzyme
MRALISASVLVALLGIPADAQAPAQSLGYGHVHFAVTDPDKARAWYTANLGGMAGETPDRVIFERYGGTRPTPVQFMWNKADAPPPSEGSVIDNIGFSFPDVQAKVAELQAAGAKVIAPPREMPGLWERAVVMDPWGVKIELVENPDVRGFHHIAVRVADPEASLQWYVNAFGGVRTKLRDRIDVLRYGTTYLLVLKGDGTVPSQGRAIDHLGWDPIDMDATAADLKSKGVTFTSGPQPKPNQFGHRTAYVEAPGGVRIELVQHAVCAWSKS